MKVIAFAIALFATANAANAAELRTLCGLNKADGTQIRLQITLDQQDEFTTVIKTVNGTSPQRHSNDKVAASGFGFRGYESIELALTSGCDGSASYRHFNADMPMNPMETLELRCVCPKH